MHSPLKNGSYWSAGFTLNEIMVSLAILSLIMAAAATSYAVSIRVWRNASAQMDASSCASSALTRCTMGAGGGFGLRSAFIPLTVTQNSQGWQIRFTTPASMTGDAVVSNSISYSVANRTIAYQTANGLPSIIGKNIITSSVVQQSNALIITVRARARVGNTRAESEMSTVIIPRNRS